MGEGGKGDRALMKVLTWLNVMGEGGKGDRALMKGLDNHGIVNTSSSSSWSLSDSSGGPLGRLAMPFVSESAMIKKHGNKI